MALEHERPGRLGARQRDRPDPVLGRLGIGQPAADQDHPEGGQAEDDGSGQADEEERGSDHQTPPPGSPAKAAPGAK